MEIGLGRILSRNGDLPVYYPEDAEVYLRAGYLSDGTLFCAVFNLGLDPLEELPLVLDKQVRSIEKLNSDGVPVPCAYLQDGDTVTVAEQAATLSPVILLIRTE